MSETQRILGAAQATDTITDAIGRTIEVRRVSRRDSMRFMRQWGTACNVQVWLGQAMVAACARAIDGVPAPAPTTADQAEMLVDKLGDEGLEAIAAWLSEAAEQTAADFKEAVKN